MIVIMPNIGSYGDSVFELTVSPRTIRRTNSYGFVQQETVIGKPRLQRVGDNLEQIEMQIRYHWETCNPQAEYNKLKSMAEAKISRALALSGSYLGQYVIESLEQAVLSMSGTGKLMCIDVNVKLLEVNVF